MVRLRFEPSFGVGPAGPAGVVEQMAAEVGFHAAVV